MHDIGLLQFTATISCPRDSSPNLLLACQPSVPAGCLALLVTKPEAVESNPRSDCGRQEWTPQRCRGIVGRQQHIKLGAIKHTHIVHVYIL